MKRLSFVCILLWASSALAQDDDKEAKAGDKVPATGQFSLLGTECKAEDETTIDTTPGSPPLDVDDPGTPGCNAWEVNIVTSGDFGKSVNWETPLFDINYGVGDNIQLKYEVPYQLGKIDGVSSVGFGRAEFGIKYRFYENESKVLTIAVYPQLEFAIPGTTAAKGDAGIGTITKFPVLMSRKIAEFNHGDVMITANAGYNYSTEPGTQHYISAAFGIGFPLTSAVAVMVEASTDQAMTKPMDGARERYVKANVGLFGQVNSHLLVLGAVGRSFASSEIDDAGHPFLIFGVRVLAGGP